MSVLKSDAEVEGEARWLKFEDVGRAYGSNKSNVVSGFNRGLRKIAHEILLHMTGEEPTDEAVLILSKNEALCTAIAEALAEKNTTRGEE